MALRYHSDYPNKNHMAMKLIERNNVWKSMNCFWNLVRNDED